MSDQLDSLTLSLTKFLLSKADLSKIYQTSKRPKKKVHKGQVAPVNDIEKDTQKYSEKLFQTVSTSWLQHHSAYSNWWRPQTAFSRPCCLGKSEFKLEHTKPQNPSRPERCIMWFQFTGHPVKYKSKASSFQVPVPEQRTHSVRVEQQPTGGAAVLIFAADLKIGETFGLLSRRHTGFTLSLTFFMDGVRDSRLCGCCEASRGANAPTRVGGPAGAFLLRAVEGAHRCQMCSTKGQSVSSPANPTLFCSRPKSSRQRQPCRSSNDGHISNIKSDS